MITCNKMIKLLMFLFMMWLWSFSVQAGMQCIIAYCLIMQEIMLPVFCENCAFLPIKFHLEPTRPSNSHNFPWFILTWEEGRLRKGELWFCIIYQIHLWTLVDVEGVVASLQEGKKPQTTEMVNCSERVDLWPCATSFVWWKCADAMAPATPLSWILL